MLNRFHLRNKDIFLTAGAGHSRKNFIAVCCISLFVHGLFFVGILLMYNFDLSKPQPRAIRVDLVSFVPGPTAGQGESDPLPGLKEEVPLESVEPNKVPLDLSKKAIADPVKAIPEPVATLKPEVSLKTKPKNLKELMAVKEKKEIPPPLKPVQRLKPKPKVDPKEALKKAREKLAKKIEKQNQKQISEALSRMQTSIDAKGNNTNRSQEIGPGTGTGTGLGKQGYSPLDLYKMVLQSAIEQNWVFNDMLARMDQRLEVRVMIKILKTGEIRDVSYETKSGNRYLDESAKKAIKRANPLPQLPKGMNSYDVVVIFTPRGLK